MLSVATTAIQYSFAVLRLPDLMDARETSGWTGHDLITTYHSLICEDV